MVAPATKGQAPTLDIPALAELAIALPGGKYDVGYRVNPNASAHDRVFGAAFDDQPSPAFYYLSPSSYAEARDKFQAATGSPRTYVYLTPLVGKLLRDAGYIGFSTRARGLSRTVEDLMKEAAKYGEDELHDLGRTEFARMLAQAKDDARSTINRQARGLKNALDSLSDVAGISPGQQLLEGLDRVLDLLKNAAPSAK